ncbi:SMC-Scp complex subunit ScpB [Helicovermis profundi]|uniref:SMC-Scp complex subunit ScpB n=1 Tax=Helicovermis profundi TaxID=3065157 RepID=A0AAU9ELW2_9FIRM|nr:SMC-Scp complex subunit ScpB [Clostridia bacterium S502]
MSSREIKGIIESLLFVWGDPISAKKLASIINEDVKKIKESINELSVEYKMRGSGIQIVEANSMYQFSTTPNNSKYIEIMCNTSKNKGLSPSTIEVLSIVAYRQPITKGEIDYIRGVKSDKAISNLIERNLIEVKGKLDKIGKPNIFATTNMFLKSFGFQTLKDLPNISEFENDSKIFSNIYDSENE